jgi:flagellar basal-body rod protein FlgB
MANSFLVDDALSASKIALDGLSQRQQVISRNLANVDTPGYKAQNIDFETALHSAMQGQKGLALTTTSPSHLASTTDKVGFTLSDRPGGSVRADGNDVDIDVELTDMSEAGIEYQAVTEAVSKKLSLLKAIANAR